MGRSREALRDVALWSGARRVRERDRLSVAGCFASSYRSGTRSVLSLCFVPVSSLRASGGGRGVCARSHGSAREQLAQPVQVAGIGQDLERSVAFSSAAPPGSSYRRKCSGNKSRARGARAARAVEGGNSVVSKMPRGGVHHSTGAPRVVGTARSSASGTRRIGRAPRARNATNLAAGHAVARKVKHTTACAQTGLTSSRGPRSER